MPLPIRAEADTVKRLLMEIGGVIMSGFNVINLFLILLLMAIPLAVLYFIIKLAVKNALKEVKEEQALMRKLPE